MAALISPVQFRDFLDGSSVDRQQKPDHRSESKQTGLHEQLQIVVVRLIDEEIGVEGAELRIDDWERSQAPAEHGFLEEHPKAVAIDGDANVIGDLCV